MNEPKYKDFPFDDVTKSVIKQLKENPNLRFFQKFTCSNCGQRLSMDIPNKFYAEGGCDKCGYTTDIKKQGCNYLLVASPDPKKIDEVIKAVQERNK